MHKMPYHISKVAVRLIASIVTLMLVIIPITSMAQSPVQFEKGIVKIKSTDSIHEFSVELAITPAQKAYGLMYRQAMPAGQGMLFNYDTPQVATMWMKNTYIPLDMVFIRSDGVIENIIQRTVPHSQAILSATNKVRGVLELNAGTTSKLGIDVGDIVIHKIFNNTNHY